MKANSQIINNSKPKLAVAKAIAISTILTLILVLIYSAVVYFFEIDQAVIPIINQIIKGVSIFVGCIFSIRGAKNGWIKGFVIGIVYTAIIFMLFSALNQDITVELSLLNDLSLGAATGLVSGIVCANIKG